MTWAVPGMNTTSADMTMWSRGAQNIYQEQARRPGSPSHAVVAWIGYETPDEKDVLFMGKAKKGGGQLADALRGLDAVRAGQMPETNVVAHSYGTTTAAVALAEQGVHVDRFVALGSAGLPDHMRSITDIQADHVYAARAKDAPTGKEGLGDEWAEFGREQSYAHHVDPTRDIFGVNVFGVDGATAADGTDLEPVLHHDPLRSDLRGYLDRGTESLRNVGLATTGRDAELTPASSG